MRLTTAIPERSTAMPQPDCISALPMGDRKTLEDDLKAAFAKCIEKPGFAPNALQAHTPLRRMGLARFFNRSNRMAYALEMMPNHEYHRLDR